MAEEGKKAPTSTVLVIADRHDKAKEVLLTLVVEDEISLFRSDMGKGFLRGRIGKNEDGQPNGTIVLSITKKDQSEVAFSTLYMNAAGTSKDGKPYDNFLAAGKNSNIAFEVKPGTKEGVTFTNIVPAGKGNDGAEVSGNIRGVDAEELNKVIPEYTSAAKAEKSAAKAGPKP